MPRKREFLELHRGQYRVVVSVPRDLQSKLGTKLKRPLATDSLTTANGVKWPIIAEFKRRIAEARGGSATDPIRNEAALFRESYAKARSDEEAEALRYAPPS
ncbi:MAG: integrase family [Beijerinckiaceae bacterium]|nr:MAG: integrase family [Beijerinckiaceae bacterium]